MKNKNWENVYVFISSTFNDMHAERDYLIKRVFPELRLWCAKRRLKLIDIDLRWGVSEKDATENKRVVEVCMQNIDKCRPFFLGFLGQRRGWVPGMEDINKDTLVSYPALETYLGNYSITELEIIHALMNPLDNVSKKVAHAFFYFRDDSYLKDIHNKEIKHLYQPSENESVFEKFKNVIRKEYEVYDYSCTWNKDKKSNELVNVSGKDLSQGRLEDFSIGDIPLKDCILSNLKAAIIDEFGNRENLEEKTSALDIELFHQDTFLFQACDSYIPRCKEEAKILDYVFGEENVPFVLKANAGSGKTSMLAYLIQEEKLKGKVFYRFCGTSIDSSNTERTLALLAQEMKERNVISEEDYVSAKDNIVLSFASLLNKVEEDITIVIDAIDQWDKALEDIYWIPNHLNKHIRLVLSLRSDSDEKLVNFFDRHKMICANMENMDSKEEKVLFIKQYMGQHLKDISDEQIDMILHLEGTGNPLYLKIVLNELRIHGSFDTLVAQLKTQYGKTPMHAFAKVMERLEKEEYSTEIDVAVLVCVYLGCLAYSLDGMNLHEYIAMFRNLGNTLSDEEIMDGVYELTRHLSPYLTIDGDHVDFLYDSFRKAVQYRYQPMESTLQMVLLQTYAEQFEEEYEMQRKDVYSRKMMMKIMHHALHHSEEAFTAFIGDITTFYPAVLNLQTSLLTSYLLEADLRGYHQPQFKEIAYALRSASLLVDKNADVVFYELRNRVHNEIVDSLIEQAKEYDFRYLAPVFEEPQKVRSIREMAYYDDSRNCERFLLDDYIVYVNNKCAWRKEEFENSIIYLQSLESEKIESALHLSYPIRKAYAKGNYIYVISSPYSEKDDLTYEVYEIPTLRKVMNKTLKSEIEEGLYLRSYCHGYDGEMYEVAESQEGIHRVVVYRIKDEKVMIDISYPLETTEYMEDGKINSYAKELIFCGPFIVESNSHHDIHRLWHIPSGTCIQKDTYASYSFAGKIDRDVFYYFQSKNDELIIDKYRFEKEQYEKVDSCTTLDVRWLAPYYIGCGCECIFMEEGVDTLRVYDENLRLIGYLSNIFTISNGLDRNEVYRYKEYIVLKQRAHLSFYKLEDIKKACVEKRPVSSDRKDSSGYDAFVYNDYLYLISSSCKKVDPYTLIEMEDATISSYNTFNVSDDVGSASGNIYHIHGDDYMILYTISSRNPLKYEFTLYNLEDFRVSARMYKEVPSYVKAAYMDNFNLGVIVERDGNDKDYTCIPEIHVYSLYDFSEVDCWRINERCKEISIVTLHHSISYIVCTCNNVDESHHELRIYHAKSKKLIYSYRYEKEIRIMDSTILVRNNKMISFGYDNRKNEYFFTVFDFMSETLEMIPYYTAKDQYVSISAVGIRDHEYFVHDFREEKIYIYSLDTFEKIMSIDIKEHPDSSKIIHKYGCYINVKKSGEIDFYSEVDGRYIKSQLIPYENVSLLDLEEEEHFCIAHGMKKYTFYHLTSTKEL